MLSQKTRAPSMQATVMLVSFKEALSNVTDNWASQLSTEVVDVSVCQ